MSKVKLTQRTNHHVIANFLADDEQMTHKKAGEFAEKLENLMNEHRVYHIDATLSPFSKSTKLTLE